MTSTGVLSLEKLKSYDDVLIAKISHDQDMIMISQCDQEQNVIKQPQQV